MYGGIGISASSLHRESTDSLIIVDIPVPPYIGMFTSSLHRESTDSLIYYTGGEPLPTAAWKWFYETVGGKTCVLIDTYGQTGTVISKIACIKHECETLNNPKYHYFQGTIQYPHVQL